jgi:hypothetical protein
MSKNPVETQVISENGSIVETRFAELKVRPSKSIGLLLLPHRFFTATSLDELVYENTTLDVKALFRGEQIELTLIESESGKLPYVENRDAHWIGPTIFISALWWSQNPEAVNLALNVLASYIYALFQGTRDQGESKTVSLSIVVEDSTGKTIKVDYEGTPSEFPPMLEAVKKNLMK